MFDKIIVQPIFNLLLIFYNLVGDFGIAIILFVIVVKMVIYPVTKMQYDQTRRMRKVQGELARIRKKYADNKQQQYLMTLAVYKKNGIKTSRSMLSLLIQFPILIAMYRVIHMIVQSTEPIKSFAYGFVKNLSRINNIIAGHEQFKPLLFGQIDLSQVPFSAKGLDSLVLIGILLALAYSQYRTTQKLQSIPTDKSGKKRRLRDVFSEAADGKEPDQTEMNQIVSGSMSKVMPVMLFFMFGAVYGAVSFYYLISNLVTMGQYSYLDKKELSETKTTGEKEIDKRLRQAETAQIVNEQHQKKQVKKNSDRRTKSSNSEQRITRIKAKK